MSLDFSPVKMSSSSNTTSSVFQMITLSSNLTDRQTYREADGEIYIERDRQTYGEMGRQTDISRDRQAEQF